MSAFLAMALVAAAADFASELKASREKGDIATEKFIAEAKAAHTDDPEYYVAVANYWWGRAREVNVSTRAPKPGDLAVKDPQTGNDVGSITTQGAVDPQLPKRAIATLQEAAKKFPLRLDIGLGLAYLQHEEKQEDACLTSLLSVLETLKTHPKTEWRWKQEGTFPEAPESFLPQSIHPYARDFFREETPEGDARCQKLEEAVIRQFPEHPYAYNIMAALSDAHKDAAGTLKYLQLAHQKAPDDVLVTMNLADCLSRQEKRAEARKLWESVVKSPKADKKYKEQAAAALLRDRA